MNVTDRIANWDDLRVLDAIAREGSLPAAAFRLGMNHSTVFRRLEQFEARTGRPVFERHRDGYVPTPSGEAIVALAGRMAQDLDALALTLAGQDMKPTGEVRLATSDALLSGLVMPALASCRVALPGIRLDIAIDNAEANLSRRDADIAVRATDAPADTLVGRRIAPIAWALYGLTGDDLAGGPFVAPGERMAAMSVGRHVAATVPVARIAARVDTVMGLAQAIASGMGCGYLPCFVGERTPGLHRLAPPVDTLATDLWLLTHREMRHVPRIRAMIDILAERLQAERALIAGLTTETPPP